MLLEQLAAGGRDYAAGAARCRRDFLHFFGSDQSQAFAEEQPAC